METYIYTLSDKTGVRYIGKSNDPKQRFRKHLNESKLKRTRKEKWIFSLIHKSETPILAILDKIPGDMWSFYESYWISQFKTWGFILVNGTDGGEGSNGFKGKKHTNETKEKCRIGALKRKSKTRLPGILNGNSKLTEYQVIEIRNLKNLSTKEIAQKFNVSQMCIRDILLNNSWTHI